MTGRLLIGVAVIACAIIGGIGYTGLSYLTQGSPPPEVRQHEDTGNRLPTQTEFDTLAERDPVAMLSVCLTRYQREVRTGIRCTVQKQERVQGSPKHPIMPPIETIELCVRGDLPSAETKQTAIEVAMKWRSGAKRALGADIVGTLYSEKKEPEGLGGKVVTWRPDAWAVKLSNPMDANTIPAQTQSRYCIRDAGVYRSMLRTHEAWKTRQEASEFKYEYLGKRIDEKTGNRECHVIKRICPRTEVDSFELGGTASTDPKVVANEGFTEVTLFVDAERWIQVGTELFRTEPDGTRVLVGAYYFRDVQLNTTFPPDTFTRNGLKK